MNDPISQQNAVRGLIEWGETVERWREDVRRQEAELIAKLNKREEQGGANVVHAE